MRAFKLILPLLLALALFSCNRTPETPSAADDTEVSTTYADPYAPDGGGIAVEGKTAGAVLDYFSEIAFGSEYGNSSERLCRWESEIIYKVTGEPTKEDLELIGFLAQRLNSVEGFPGISEAGLGESPNFEIMFVPQSTIIEEFPDATDACVGMSEYRWLTDSSRIIEARAAIDSAATDERNSTICEEILQAMGLAMDSYTHRDSVFYQGKCVYSRPSALDWAMVEVLYHPSLRTGMSKYEALTAATGILKW